MDTRAQPKKIIYTEQYSHSRAHSNHIVCRYARVSVQTSPQIVDDDVWSLIADFMVVVCGCCQQIGKQKDATGSGQSCSHIEIGLHAGICDLPMRVIIQ